MASSSVNSTVFDPTSVLRSLAGIDPTIRFQFEDGRLADNCAAAAARSEDDVDAEDDDVDAEDEEDGGEEVDDELEDEVDEDDEIEDGDDEYEDEEDDEDVDEDEGDEDIEELTTAPVLRADGLLGYEDEEEDVEKGRSREQGDAVREREEQAVDEGEPDDDSGDAGLENAVDEDKLRAEEEDDLGGDASSLDTDDVERIRKGLAA